MKLKHCRGFTLVELLVTIAITSIITGSLVSSLRAGNSSQIDQDNINELTENLRTGMQMVTDALRNAKFATPSSNLTSWFPSGGFSTSVIVPGTNTLNVATCVLGTPLVKLNTNAASGATSITLGTNQGLGIKQNNIVVLDYREPALVKSADDTTPTITIDTDPATTGNQGTTRAYPSATPLCVVRTTSFTITSEGLVRTDSSSSATAVAEGITALSVASVSGTTNRYTVALTGTTTMNNGSTITRSLTADTSVAN